MATQKLIDNENAGRYVLSPYVDICAAGNGALLLIRRDIQKSVVLSGADTDGLMSIVHMLESSANLDQIAEFVTSGDLLKAEHWIALLVRNGVVE